jgi:hypothetical protein
MLAAARAHLSSRGQTDTLTAHFEYLNRTTAGLAIITIEDVKLGKQLSTLHLTLWQDGLLPKAPWIDASVSRRSVLAYATQTNLDTAIGISMPTGFEVTSEDAYPPPPDFEALKSRGEDARWEVTTVPDIYPGRSLRNWGFYIPKGEQLIPGVLDTWMRRTNGEMICTDELAYVVDSFPYNLHKFLASPEMRKFIEDSEKPKPKVEEKEKEGGSDDRATLWFPTVVLNLEVKKKLPEDGTEWLAMRVTSKQIKDGRFDLDVLIRDAEGEVVALSHHVAMILSMGRNTKKRKTEKAVL